MVRTPCFRSPRAVSLDDRTLGSHHGAALRRVDPGQKQDPAKVFVSADTDAVPTLKVPGLCPVSVKGLQATLPRRSNPPLTERPALAEGQGAGTIASTLLRVYLPDVDIWRAIEASSRIRAGIRVKAPYHHRMAHGWFMATATYCNPPCADGPRRRYDRRGDRYRCRCGSFRIRLHAGRFRRRHVIGGERCRHARGRVIVHWWWSLMRLHSF